MIPLRTLKHLSQLAFLALLLLAQGFSPAGPVLAEAPARITATTEIGLSSAEWVAHPQQRAHLLGLGVKPWFERGIRGQGMKVAVLDSGFQGYRDYLGKGLPATVEVRSFRQDGNLEARASQHGILCAEVIHTVAPA